MSDYYDYYEEDEGIHFGPTDEELINEYLIPKLGGDHLHDDFIMPKNVYAKEPWLLDHNMDPFFQKNEWYYFVTRTQVSKKKTGCGKKAKRKIAGDNNDGIERGNWKANATAEIKDSKTGKVIGKKQNLTYTRSNNNKKHKGGDGTCVVVPESNDSWIMTEYMLPDGDKFQELVLCKINTIKRSKKKDHYYQASTSTYSHNHHEASTSEQKQPLLCGPEIQRIESSSSLTCPAVETEKNIEPSVEGNCVSLIESTLQISSEKDEQVKDIEVTHELEKDWVGDMMDKYAEKGLEGVLMINNEDQQPPLIFASAEMNVPLARLGDKLDDDSNEYAPFESTQEWLKEFEKFLDDDFNEDAPLESTQERMKELETLLLTENYNTPIMDQDLRDQCDALVLTRSSQTC